ncbi:MAG: hypothetical protein VCC00_10020 [Deltaproteobacteria bacterium]
MFGIGCGGSSNSDLPQATPTPEPGPTAEPTPVPTAEPTPEPTPDACPDGADYESTWEGIYEQVFVAHNCANDTCHGSGMAGGLDLRADVAWENIHEMPANGSALDLIEPGDNDASYLWLKVAAKTNPGSVTIGGAPMPTSATTLSADQLELLRLWIKSGAPETGTVTGTAELLNACLPDEVPIAIRPLDPPDVNEGLQLVLPEYPLPAGTEREVCFAAYYDFSDQVPAEFQSDDGENFFVESYDLRQDPHSHHLIIMNYQGSADVDHAAFGQWTCLGGDDDGIGCAPKTPGICGDGYCISQIRDTPGCTGFGPPGGPSPLSTRQVLVAQQAAETRYLPEGIYSTVPLRGIVYWNSHAFNLTAQDLKMHGRVNWIFATNREQKALEIFDADMILAPRIPAYETKTYCNTWVAPQGTRLFNLLSHTHQRGGRFWVNDPDGNQIYENFVYNDPVNQYYDPPLVFDSSVADERTLSYCADYNNGVDADGNPDPSVVKRFSEIPNNTFFLGGCTPSHCWSGKVGDPCGGENDHTTCDSSPGAGDGLCDACEVSGGVTTEDEMFLLLGSYYIE